MTALPVLPSFDSLLQAAANTTDSLGNIFNAKGDHIGVVPGSVADIGSGGKTVGIAATQQVAPAPAAATQQVATTPAKSSGGILSGVSGLGAFFTWAADIVNRDKVPNKGVSLEDLILIVLGLVLLSAAVVGLIFISPPAKAARNEIKSAIGAAKGGARSKLRGAASSAGSAATTAAMAALVP